MWVLVLLLYNMGSYSTTGGTAYQGLLIQMGLWGVL